MKDNKGNTTPLSARSPESMHPALRLYALLFWGTAFLAAVAL